MENKTKAEPQTPQPSGGVGAKWSGGYAGVGEKFFGYGNRMMRPLLWLGVFFIVAVQFAPIRALLGYDETYVFDGLTAFWILFPAVVLGLGWWRYQEDGIVVFDLGLRQRSLLGNRTLLWTEIVAFQIERDEYRRLNRYRVQGRNRRVLLIWPTITDLDELLDLIEERARWAIGSWR